MGSLAVDITLSTSTISVGYLSNNLNPQIHVPQKIVLYSQLLILPIILLPPNYSYKQFGLWLFFFLYEQEKEIINNILAVSIIVTASSIKV